MPLWVSDGMRDLVRGRPHQWFVPAPRNPRLPELRTGPNRVPSSVLRGAVRQLQGVAGPMKITLVCSECQERFTIRGDVAWDGIECPACGYVGNVIGRIMDGKTTYFADEDETTQLPVVLEEQTEEDDE